MRLSCKFSSGSISIISLFSCLFFSMISFSSKGALSCSTASTIFSPNGTSSAIIASCICSVMGKQLEHKFY
ncbi:hypothetical protein, partial [Campylobacter sputorum]|uniref:hypothetical protein n=1 Tax=Campylobacter sputorum TaxID=206 RepID=UPI0019D3EE18